MNILILLFLFWTAVPGYEHTNQLQFLFWMAVLGHEHINFTFFGFEWQLPAMNINFTSVFISLLFLFSFHNKNVLFWVENKKKLIYFQFYLRLTFPSFSIQNILSSIWN